MGRRGATTGAFAFLAFGVLAFTGGWSRGDLILDGRGVSLWVRLLLEHWRAGDGIPSWMPDMWAGTPASDLFNLFHVLILVPIAAVVGPDGAVKIGVLAAQVFAGWGAYVLARSLWGSSWAALAAGFLYGLHPLFLSHGGLFGQEPTIWVFAITPWLTWSLRLALRRSGSRYVAFAGLFLGFAVLQQAEQAYSLVLLCGMLVLLEFARARHRGSGPTGPSGVVFRAGAVVVIGLGIVAHWMVPFLGMSKWFVLTPRSEVRSSLEFISGALSREPGTFLDRSAGITGPYGLNRFLAEVIPWKGAIGSSLYLSAVCVILVAATALLLSRRRDDGTLSAILLASILGIWLSMGPISVASGGLAARGRFLSLIVVGALAGLLIGNFLRCLELKRTTRAAALAAALLLFAVPYLTPLISLSGIVPFLGSIRAYRLYNIAALGVALGAAYPLTRAQTWAAARRPRLAPLLGGALCLALLGAFVVDVHPYRTYYRVRGTDATAAYRQISDSLADDGGDARVATVAFGNPQSVEGFFMTGREQSVGWPHPLASKNVWRLTAEVIAGNSPNGYKATALGLSGTAYVAGERISERDDQPRSVEDVNVRPNPRVLPLVRAYEHAVVVADGEVTPELAVALSVRNVGVVEGGEATVKALGAAMRGFDGSTRACDRTEPPGDRRMAAEVAMACAMHAWVGVNGRGGVTAETGAGGVFASSVDGLRGVTVWLDRFPGPTELVLREMAADGGSPGRQVASTTATDVDENAMARFLFDPIADSAGKRYSFHLSCPQCLPGEVPQMGVMGQPRAPGNLLIGDRLQPATAAAFSPLYDGIPPADVPSTAISARRPGPGRWLIDASGERDSLLVVAESYFPGWKAEVDGENVDVVEADGGFLGVPLPAGRHQVTLEYHRSAAVPFGRVITAMTLLFCAFLILAPRFWLRRAQGRADSQRALDSTDTM